MFIRRTKTRNANTGEAYFTHRLVQSKREGTKVKQVTLLNLGRHFRIPQDHWVTLCTRIEELLSPQETLFPVECTVSVEREAQRITSQLLVRQPTTPPPMDNTDSTSTGNIQSVDVDSLELTRPRTIGVEFIGLWAMEQVGFQGLLEKSGMIPITRINYRKCAVAP